MSTAITRITAWSLDLATVNRLQTVALAAITFLAATLRFYKLGEWSFWIDEIYTINHSQAHYSSVALMLRNIPPHTNWIPVSLLLTSGVISKLGISEWSVRLAPAMIGTVSIPILYLPIKKMFGSVVALISALLLAVSPWHILWSQNGRFYVALMLFYTLALLAFYFGLEYKRPAYLILGMPLFYLALSERMLAGFAVPVIAVYLIAALVFRFSPPAGLNPPNVLILLIPVFTGLAIEVHSLVSTGSSRFLGDADAFIGYAIDSPVRILILIVFSIGVPVVVLGAFAGGWLALQRSRAGLFMLVSAMLPIALLIGISPWAFVVERYALITLPAWLILTAVAIEQLAKWLPRQGRWLGAAVLVLLLADAAASHLMYYQLNNGNRPDWRGAFAYVAAHKAPGDLVVSTRPEIGRYYLGTDQDIIGLPEINPAQLVAREIPVWFVIDSEAVWDAPGAKTQWMEENARLLFVWYLRMREKIDVRVYHYQPTRSVGER